MQKSSPKIKGLMIYNAMERDKGIMESANTKFNDEVKKLNGA